MFIKERVYLDKIKSAIDKLQSIKYNDSKDTESKVVNATNDLIWVYNFEIKDNTELISKYPDFLKDCRVFIQKTESKNEEDLKMLYTIFTELGWTETDMKSLKDCCDLGIVDDKEVVEMNLQIG